MDEIEKKTDSEIMHTIPESVVVELRNIVEQIINPTASYNKDRIEFANNTIDLMIKTGHRIREILDEHFSYSPTGGVVQPVLYFGKETKQG